LDTAIVTGSAVPLLDEIQADAVLLDRRLTDPFGVVDTAGPDAAAGWAVAGWAVDRARPGEPVHLLVVHRGQVVAEGTTGIERQDVIAAGAGTGRPGFSIALPEGLARIPGARIAVHEALTGRELLSSPITLRGPSPALDAEARDLVAALVSAEVSAALDATQLDEAVAFLLRQFDRLYARRAAFARDAAERQAAFARLLQGRPLYDLLADAARSCLSRYKPLHLPPEMAPECSVVIPAHGHFAATYRCIESILHQLPKAAIEIVLVDDGSQDETVFAGAVVTGGVQIHRLARNEGFVAAANAGAALARGRTVMLLNNDTVVEEGWLDALLGTFTRDPSVGIAGSRLLSPDGTLQECGGIVWRDGTAWNWGRGADANRPEYRYLRDVDYVSGAAMMVSRALWDELGGFDPLFAPGYYEDADLCFRARAAGRRVVVQPASRVVHHEGTTAGRDVTGAGMKRLQPVNHRRFQRRWEAELRHRPALGEDPRPERVAGPVALVVDNCVPTPDQDAGSNAVVEHMRALQRLGYRVRFVASDRLEHSRRYTALLEQEGIQCFDAPYYGSVEEVLRREGSGVKLVYLYRPGNAAQFTSLVRQRLPGARVVYSMSDLHHLRIRREGELVGSPELLEEAARVEAVEMAAVHAADAVIVHSEHEAALLRAAAPRAAITTVPWTVPVRPVTEPFARRSGLAFIGGYRHTPNVDAARYLVETVMPLVWAQAPEIEVRLVGSNMPESVRRLAGPRVQALGQVADLSDVLGQVRLTAAPLRYGAGLKGKVLSSFAVGVPCAMTAIAAEGMALLVPLPEAVARCVAVTPEALAAAVVALHEDPARNQAAAEAGLAWVGEACSAEHVDRLLAEACGLAAVPPRGPGELAAVSAVRAPAARSRAGRKRGLSMSGSANAPRIQEHMAVVGSDGGHVGTVDKVEGDRIKLTKEDDPDGSGQHHHFLPVSAVASVENNEVRLNMPGDRAKALATATGGSEPAHGMGSMGAS
jgi:GT2 family glycosyltransferase